MAAKTEGGRVLRELFRSRRQMYLSLVYPDINYPAINPAWDGVADSRGIEKAPVWDGLANYAEKNNIDMMAWVDTLFSMTYLFDKVPDPNRLKDKRILAALANAKGRLRQDNVHRTKAQISIVLSELFQTRLASALPEQTVYKTVLIHPELDASPLVRYVLARRLGVDRVATVFKMGAAVQYATDKPAYDDALASYKSFLTELASVTDQLQ